MPNAESIRLYSFDPALFLADLRIPSAHGPARFGDIMAEFQRERFGTIVPGLVAVANGTLPPIGKYWWEATKGASKDSDLACCLLWLLAFTRRPLTIQIGAADQDQADELRKAAKLILRLNSWLAQRVEVQSWKIVCKATASDADVITADTSGSHGARPDVLILNELSHVQKWEFAENLLDNASKVPQGLVVIATNAGFLGTPAWKWRELARTSDRWNFNAYDCPSPWLSEAEIEEARLRNSTARFNRLWYGIWASGSGDALDPVDLEAAVDRSLAPMVSSPFGQVKKPRHPLLPRMEAEQDYVRPEPPPVVSYSFVGGLDLATRHDFSALVILAADHKNQRVRLAHCRSWKPSRTGKIDLEEVERGVLEAHQRFRLSTLAFDPYQADLLTQRLQRLAQLNTVPVPFVGKQLDLMARTLLEAFKSRKVSLYPEEELIAGLRGLSMIEKSYGYKLEANRTAETGHADLAIAFSIALPFAVELAGQTYGPGSVIRLESVPVLSGPAILGLKHDNQGSRVQGVYSLGRGDVYDRYDP